MTTVSDLVDLTKRQLYGSHRAEYNFLAAAVTAAATTFQFADDLRGITPGTLLALDDEVVYVRSTAPAQKKATVARAWYGTESLGHTLDTLVEVAPRWPQVEIKKQLENEIRSWPTALFQVVEYDTTIKTTSRVIDLSAADQYQSILRVQRQKVSSGVGDPVWAETPHRLVGPNSDYPNGALVLEHELAVAQPISVLLAKPFDLGVFDPDTDLVDDCGLADSMLDIPPLGAAWRLLGPNEIRRMDLGTQSEPRIATEIPAGSILASAQRMLLVRDRRLDDEAKRLRDRFPWKAN